jgi:hypothetical protein
MSYKQFTEQEYQDIHDTVMVLLAVAGDCNVSFNEKVGEVFRRAYSAVRTERDPPLALLPYHGKNKRLALPEGVRQMMQDQYLEPPAAPGKKLAVQV